MAHKSLVVCADAEAVQALTRVLQNLNIEVEHCGTHAAAAERIANERFDAILIDCENETEAADLIVATRTSSGNQDSLVIAIVDAGNSVREVFAQGANFILYKPVSEERATHSLRAARKLMRGERRRSRRIPATGNASVDFETVEKAPAFLVNLSEGGLAIHADRKLPPPAKIYFQFALPGQDKNIRLSADVVWQDFRGRVGLRFSQVPQSSRRAIDHWLHANFSRHVEMSSGAPETDAPQFELEHELIVSAETASLEGAPPQATPQSPSALEAAAPAQDERREQTRRACRLGAEVNPTGTNTAQRCSLTDISDGGCYLETTEPYPVGTKLEIVVRTARQRLLLRGSVKSFHPGFGVGVQFNLKTPEDKENVRQLLEAQTAMSEVFAQ